MTDPTAEEMREFLKSKWEEEVFEDWSSFEFDLEGAIYWFANDWHGGGGSNLYAALSSSPFRPGPTCSGPQADTTEQLMYEDLEAEYAHS